jgi:pachytene checkpoint protein 2
MLSFLLKYSFFFQGLSGRSLRKLPFLTHAALVNPSSCDADAFLRALVQTARRELTEARG